MGVHNHSTDLVIVMMMLSLMGFAFLGLLTMGLQHIIQMASYDPFDDMQIAKLRKSYNAEYAKRLEQNTDIINDRKPGL